MKLSDARRKIICAIDTSDLTEAISTVQRLNPYAAAFKIGHALTLPNGLSIIARLRDAGAERIFLDLKFHDIPNVVGLAVREAARYGAWMTTLHLGGGKAMVTAAVEEARSVSVEKAPLLVGVSVLTSLSEQDLHEDLGIGRSLEAHVVGLSRMGVGFGLDGVVCSVHEAAFVRPVIGDAVIVTPGIRPSEGDTHDQSRVANAKQAMEEGADYMVIGR
ncbi:MAG: orotidine-5'-phosphate decarboxylase, partial [Armatimonadota bacterium]